MSVMIHGFPDEVVPLLRKTARLALAHRPGISPRDINLVMIQDREIRKMNRRFRRVDRITDVISFRYSPDPLDGDIFISEGRSRKQARRVGHSWEKELSYLVIHGILHLFDYTDYTPEERARMFRRQDRLYRQLFGEDAPSSAADGVAAPGRR